MPQSCTKVQSRQQKRQFFHINHGECKRQAYLRPVSEKSVLGIKWLQFLVAGMSLPPDGTLEPLGRVLVKHAVNPSQDRGQPEMPWTPTSQEQGKSLHGSHAELLHIIPYLSDQWVWRLISPEETLRCSENVLYAQESKCLGKLPNHCKGSFWDHYQGLEKSIC